MQSGWTLKPFYGRYTHQLEISTSTGLEDPVRWASANLKCNWRKRDNTIRDGSARDTVSVSFFTMRTDHELLLERFGDRIISVRQPFHDQAEGELLQGMHLTVRPHIYFNRYRYSLRFFLPRRDPPDMRAWCASSLGEDRSAWLVRGNFWFPTVYVAGQTELLLLKMAHGEYAIDICRAYTQKELGDWAR